MEKWLYLLLLVLLVSCGQGDDDEITPVPLAPVATDTTLATTVPVATTVVATTAATATAVVTKAATAQATTTAEPVAATAIPAPFVYASHFGGGPAGQWDRSNFTTFVAAYPELEYQQKTTDYYRAFVNRTIYSQLESADRPDVVTAALGGHLRAYAEQGLIADISDLWAEQGWDEQFPASIKAMSTVNGRQYFVPQAIQWNGIFFRTDVMAASGVTPPTTWAELLAACDSLNEAGITPFAMTATPTWPPPMGFWFTHINQRLNGPDFHEQLMRGEVEYTDPRVLAVFEHYGQLFEHQCFASGATSTGYSTAISLYESGGAAMYAHGEWLYEFIDEETKAATDLIRFPIIDETVPLGELVPMWGAFMLADTAYQDEARAFLTFVGNEASQLDNLTTLKRLPSNLDVDRSELLPVYEKGLQLVSEATVLTQLIGANTEPAVASALLSAIGDFWRNPEDIESFLAEVEEKRLAAYAGSPTEPTVALNFEQGEAAPVIGRDLDLSSRLDPGAMIYHDGLFHMFLNRFDRFPGAVEVGYATSVDGRIWEEHEGEPLLTTESVPFAEVAVVASDVIVTEAGEWVLYFHTWQTLSLINGQGVIGRATAPAPLGPWTVDPQPVLTMADSSDEWDGGQVSIADIVVVPGGFHMYYTGASTRGLMQIGLAVSEDGISWDKYDDPTTTDSPYAESDPVVANGDSGQWDANAAFTSRLFVTEEGWFMLYKNVGTRTRGAQMGVAVSQDGISWRKTSNSPIFGSDLVEAGRAFGLTNLVAWDGQLYLYTEHYTDSVSSTDIYLLLADIP